MSRFGDGGALIPPRSIFGGWFVGACGVRDGWGRCSQGRVLAVWGTGGAGVASTPAGQESQGGMHPRGDGEAGTGVEEVADTTRPDWS